MDRESEKYSLSEPRCPRFRDFQDKKGTNCSMKSKKYSSKHEICYSEGKIYPSEATKWGLEANFHPPEATKWGLEAKFCPSEAINLGREGNFCPSDGKIYPLSELEFTELRNFQNNSHHLCHLSEPRYPRFTDFPAKNNRTPIHKFFTKCAGILIQDILHIYLQSGESFHPGYRGSDYKKHYFFHTDNAASIAKSSLHHEKGNSNNMKRHFFHPDNPYNRGERGSEQQLNNNGGSL